MSFPESFEESVKWFSNLSATKKERIIEEFGQSLEVENLGKFADIVRVIQNNVSIDDTDSAVEILTESGMSSMFAENFVNSVVENSPPRELIVAEWAELTGEEFQRLVELSVRQYSEAIADEDITGDITPKTTSSDRLQRMVQRVYMQYLSGDFLTDTIKDSVIDYGLPEERADYLIETYLEYEDITWRRLVFFNTQNVRTEDIEDLRSQQREIRQHLDQLLTIVEDAAQNTDT